MRPTTRIELDQGTLSINAAIVAEGLGIEVATVHPLMRDGKITSLCERGVGRDSGRHRVTFFHGPRWFSLVIGSGGQVIGRATGEASDRAPRPLTQHPPE
jgi:hypothetical protein